MVYLIFKFYIPWKHNPLENLSVAHILKKYPAYGTPLNLLRFVNNSNFTLIKTQEYSLTLTNTTHT